ncbi:MAG: HK97 family phage prohead protease [Pseudomonadota bacterium]
MRAAGQEILIEGYAALFGTLDSGGDVIRAGAFARSLRARAGVPMLLQHRGGVRAGHWTRIVEDGRGLFVRGLVESGGATRAVSEGLDGLSIGFRPRLWRPRRQGGRELIDVELVEISLVSEPMQALARLMTLTTPRRQAA